MLGPDACLVDRPAPCFYWHLKQRALNGERDKLSDEELEFVGVGRRRRRPGGWHEPETEQTITDVPSGLDFLA